MARCSLFELNETHEENEPEFSSEDFPRKISS